MRDSTHPWEYYSRYTISKLEYINFVLIFSDRFYFSVLNNYSIERMGILQKRASSSQVRQDGAHVDLHEPCGVRTYNLKGEPLLVKKRNAFMQFYQIQIKAL